MTCIVGLVHDDKVYMGGDSGGITGWSADVAVQPKVFSRGKFIIGYTTSFRMGQILEYKLKVKKQKNHQFTFEYMSTTFVDAVRKLFIENGYNKFETDGESKGGRFLVGYKNRLFMIDTDFQVFESTKGYTSIGCGAEYALGSMYSTQHINNPLMRINKAVDASIEFSIGCVGPVSTVSL